MTHAQPEPTIQGVLEGDDCVLGSLKVPVIDSAEVHRRCQTSRGNHEAGLLGEIVV